MIEHELTRAILAELRTIRTLLLLQSNAFQSPRAATNEIAQTIDQLNYLEQATRATGVPGVPPLFTMSELRPCEICGQPALSFVVDVIETTKPDDTARTFKPGNLHHYCGQHTRPSATAHPDGAITIEPFDWLFHYGITHESIGVTPNDA